MFDVSPSVTRHSQRGIALVITLIMLAVTLVMAVAFLAIARRERNAATTATDTAVARLADDAALAAAQAQIAANILATTNPYNYSLLVSTNYQNGAGFFTGVASPTNVNYDFYNGTGLGPVSGNDLVQNIANLYLLPRAPVFVNNPNTGLNDFRFYLDLNRNGAFDPNGVVTNVEIGLTGPFTNGTVTVQGDPEWIGVLEHPDQPHSPNNPFVARYAFLAQPAGNSLDLNYIHNQTRNANPPNMSSGDGFFRNESVGSWELNLAAFLADLNTNQWDNSFAPYYYNQWLGSFNSGNAFSDAASLLAWRYAFNYDTLPVPPGYFYNALEGAGVDGYTLGNLMTNTALPVVNPPLNTINAPWAGSDNTNRFFSVVSDLFDPTKSSAFFTGRLAAAGKSVATYDRYTYYRMLDELGTDSTADDSRMNLNYRNITNGVVVPGLETNCYPWGALDFFTNAADRMLRYYTANWASANFGAFTNTFGASVTGAFGVASIPVYINGQMVYSPAVNRILQLAANMYDATTNQTAALGRDYPSVFRPVFTQILDGTNQDVFIIGYNQVTNVNTATFNTDPANPLYPPFSLPDIVSSMATGVPNYINIYGVPWIVGAKKGYPNFNEFAMANTLAITRRLQLTRTTNNSAVQMTGTNQMYTMGLNSSIGIEFWNSYISNYSGIIWVGVNENASLSITNDDPNFYAHPGTPVPNYFTNNAVYAVTNWTGSGTGLAGGSPNTNSFMVASYVGPTMPISAYRSPSATAANLVNGLVAPCFMNTNYFGYLAPSAIYETNTANGFHFPQFGVVLTNRLQVFMLAVDSGGTRVIDYASFAGPDGGFNVNSNLADPDGGGGVQMFSGGGVWSTNYPAGSSAPNGVTWGILNQITASKNGPIPTPDGGGAWKADPEAYALGTTAGSQAANFTAFFKAGFNLHLSVQAPFTPTRNVVQYLLWQANDPLVHYLASDLVSTVPMPTTGLFPQPGLNSYNPGQTLTPLTSLMGQQLNDNFMPWGGNPKYKNNVVSGFILTNKYNLEIKDPSVAQSDNWDFPNYKFPTVGWLGRVHRGTPWQTVYLKASDITANNNYLPWQQWTGDQNIFDATNAAPVQDAGLFDLFSTAPNGNATHGTLSVNQVHLAAWSAVFSGLVVTNSISGGYTNIPPAGPDSVNSAVALLVNGTQGINATRANTSLFPLGAFTHIGDILRTPALTEQSPFLNWSDPAQQQSGISDELYEWLPQQTLGLLRLSSTPRYVVYCYGQTLRPAPNSVVTSSSLLPSGMNPFGLVTNYQITAESAARAVIRVDNATTKAPRVVVESYVPLPPK